MPEFDVYFHTQTTKHWRVYAADEDDALKCVEHGANAASRPAMIIEITEPSITEEWESWDA